MNEWTTEAEEAICMCETWAAKVVATMPCQLFLFGSVIYKGGEQFNREQSDLDIVCLLPEPNTALTRLSALQILHGHKAELELEMIRALSRSTCTEPGVSIVAITELEMHANIHKSGARRFFDKNFFYNLIAKQETLGIPQAGTHTVMDEYQQALEYVQKIRNEYLSVCANGTGGLREFRGADPMPKALLRAAAQLNPDAVEGEWYDTRLGLELMHSILRQRRTEGEEFKCLFDRISVRRGGRGSKASLSPDDQLLLAEMLFDSVGTGRTEEVAIWDLRLCGQSFTPDDVDDLFAGVRRLVPDAQLIGIRRGSVILRVRSSLSGYTVLVDLQRFDVLAKILNVDSAELVRIDGDPLKHEELRVNNREQRLIDHISLWRPQSVGSWRLEENEFAKYLLDATETDPLLKGVLVEHNVQMGGVEVPYEMDFLLSWADPDKGHERLGVDLTRLSSPSTFFHKISQLLPLGRPVILVAVGKANLLDKLKPDIARLTLLNANVRVIPVVVQDLARMPGDTQILT